MSGLQVPSFPCATFRRTPSAFCFGAEGARLVHLVRHGQSYHNVAAAVRGPVAHNDKTLKDARLDDSGHFQAATLGSRIREAKMTIGIVIVSPMTRALETATSMFPLESRLCTRFRLHEMEIETLKRQRSTLESIRLQAEEGGRGQIKTYRDAIHELQILDTNLRRLVETLPPEPQFRFIAVEMCRYVIRFITHL